MEHERGRTAGAETGGARRVGPVVHCGYCPAAIRFVRTRAGFLMPVETEMVDVWLLKGWRAPGAVTVLDADGTATRGHPLRAPADAAGLGLVHVQGWLPHFGHCPGYPK